MAHSYSVTEKKLYIQTAVYCETLHRMIETVVFVQTKQSDTKRQVTRNLVCFIYVY
jgi:hypothetical protein